MGARWDLALQILRICGLIWLLPLIVGVKTQKWTAIRATFIPLLQAFLWLKQLPGDLRHQYTFPFIFLSFSFQEPDIPKQPHIQVNWEGHCTEKGTVSEKTSDGGSWRNLSEESLWRSKLLLSWPSHNQSPFDYVKCIKLWAGHVVGGSLMEGGDSESIPYPKSTFLAPLTCWTWSLIC